MRLLVGSCPGSDGQLPSKTGVWDRFRSGSGAIIHFVFFPKYSWEDCSDTGFIVREVSDSDDNQGKLAHVATSNLRQTLGKMKR